jgi:glycosyltransferase involved in cell wall biosynthesis
LTEGLPITLLEAMQAKVPIVTTRVGGIPDVLSNGEAGLLVDAQNPKAFSEAISTVQKNAELGSRLATAARKTFEERYSSAIMATGYSVVYKAVIEEY